LSVLGRTETLEKFANVRRRLFPLRSAEFTNLPEEVEEESKSGGKKTEKSSEQAVTQKRKIFGGGDYRLQKKIKKG